MGGRVGSRLGWWWRLGVNTRRSPGMLSVSCSALLVLGLLACSSDKPASTSSSPGVNSTVAATATPQAARQAPAPAAKQAAAELTPDGNRVYEDVKFLSQAPRPAGTAREKEAADFIAEKLRTAGYEVSFQEFPVQTQARDVSLSARGSESRTISSLPLQGTASGKVQAPLVAAGIGRPNEFSASAKGAIVLIQRGELMFNDKVANAQTAGAAAAVIFNNEPDVFNGSLSREAQIPVLAISGADGQSLLSALDKGRIDVDLFVGDNGRGTSRNVIAKPPGRDCATITGGHYDSVPVAPGASDNGTGTATVIEIASVLASKGQMGSNCFVLFGAEELGLVGSRYFVQNLERQARSGIKAMFNFDMVGVGNDGWLFIGDSNLQRQAQSAGSRVGVNGALGQLGNSSSDHASFTQAGIPAFMLYRTTDNLLHTPQDVIDRVRPEILEQAAKLGVAMLESLNAGS
jgi:aminopeptidase YwaD